MKDVNDLVKDAFAASDANGYGEEIRKMRLGEIVLDMMAFDADLERLSYSVVAQAVEKFLQKEKEKKRPLYAQSAQSLRTLAKRIETEGVMAFIDITTAEGVDPDTQMSRIGTVNKVIIDCIIYCAEMKEKGD